MHNVPKRAKVEMLIANANPIELEKYSPDQPRVPAGNPDGGQWTAEGGTVTYAEQYEETAHTTSRRVSKPNKEGITDTDRKNPRFRGMTDTQIKKQKFVDAHLSATEKAAKELNVPVANILGVAALESGWGLGSFVLDGPTVVESTNSYFGMHAPAPFMDGTTQASSGPALVASFASYEDSLKAFVAVKGPIIRNISDPLQFATVIQIKGEFGIDMITGKFDPTYIPKLTDTIRHLPPTIAYTRKYPNE